MNSVGNEVRRWVNGGEKRERKRGEGREEEVT